MIITVFDKLVVQFMIPLYPLEFVHLHYEPEFNI